MLSQIQLRSTSFKEVSIAIREEGSFAGTASFSHYFGCGIVDEGKRLWRVEMRWGIVEDQDRPFAYKGKIDVTGIVQIHSKVPKGKIKELVELGGSALLYGVIREMVSNITYRSTKGHLMLPTISFQTILNRAKKPKVAKKEAE